MRVLLLTNLPAPYAVDFFQEFGKRCELTVLFERNTGKGRDAKWTASQYPQANYKEIYMSGIPVGNEGAFCPSVLRHLSDKQYDIIIIGTYYTPTGMLAIEYLNLMKKPFIMKIDGGIPKEDKGLKRRVKQHFIGSAVGWLSSGKVTSDYVKRYGASEDRIYWYPFTSLKGEDILSEPVPEEEKQRIKKELGIKEERIAIAVGQFIPRKGHDVIMRAFSGMDADTGLYIIGGEPTEEYLSIKREASLENIHFVEFKTKEALKQYYKAADLFVFPTREDIWGLVVNEAMAHGLPVVSSNNSVAAVELVRDGENGYLIQGETIEEYNHCLRKIFNDKDLRKGMAQSSLRIIKNYTIENMAAYCYHSIEKICDVVSRKGKFAEKGKKGRAK